MALKYRITKRKNSIDPKGGEYYIMQSISTGELDIDRLSLEISNRCTAAPGDVYVVLMELGRLMEFHLMEGKIINLKGIGRFKMGFKSTSKPAPELLKPSEIQKFHVNFRPAPEIKKLLKSKSITVQKERPRK